MESIKPLNLKYFLRRIIHGASIKVYIYRKDDRKLIVLINTADDEIIVIDEEEDQDDIDDMMDGEIL